MYRRAIAITGCLALTLGSAAVAQDVPTPVGIDALCGDAALEPTTAEITLGPEQAAALDAVLRGLVAPSADPELALGLSGPAPGAVVSVETPEGRYHRAIGVADVASCEPLDPNSPFAIGSHTKMFVAAVVYQLQEEGLLSTSDLVRDYLPDEIALFPRQADATIDHLLTHTSGLPDYENSENPEALGPRLYSGDTEALGLAVTPNELIVMAAELQDDPDQPRFGPGEPGHWQYANTGFIMLGQIIEQVTGQPWTEAVRERVLDPLSLDDTVLVGGVADPELGLPSGYLTPPFDFETNGWDYSQAGAAGNAVSTIDDMATFVEAYYSGELFDDPATLDAVLEPAAPGYPGHLDDYRYIHAGFEKYGFLGHSGGTPGFTSDAGYDPASDTTIVVWANASESNAGDGIVPVGHALGMAPSVIDHVTALFEGQMAAAE